MFDKEENTLKISTTADMFFPESGLSSCDCPEGLTNFRHNNYTGHSQGHQLGKRFKES